MKILAIETSTLSESIAILENENLIGEITLNIEMTHCEKLIPGIEQLLNNTKIDISAIELIAASIGPGSFTGLRIGLMTAKSLAQVLNIPIIGISSLDALAAQVFYTNYLICPILDAKKNEIYTSLYQFQNDEIIRLENYYVISPIEWFEKIKKKKRKIIFLGNGINKEEIKKIVKNSLFMPEIFSPKASFIALLGFKKFKTGIKSDFSTIEPMYLRNPFIRTQKKYEQV